VKGEATSGSNRKDERTDALWRLAVRSDAAIVHLHGRHQPALDRVIAPLLAKLFQHWSFGMWMVMIQRRYVHAIVCHCNKCEGSGSLTAPLWTQVPPVFVYLHSHTAPFLE
jgi:hypothetical protein